MEAISIILAALFGVYVLYQTFHPHGRVRSYLNREADRALSAMPRQPEIVGLIEQITEEFGGERGVVCARDLLLQWKLGQLNETYDAWLQWASDKRHDRPLCDCNRHGAWVPAIPMKL